MLPLYQKNSQFGDTGLQKYFWWYNMEWSLGQGLKNCVHACIHLSNVYKKAYEHKQKDMHMNFEIPLAFKSL